MVVVVGVMVVVEVRNLFKEDRPDRSAVVVVMVVVHPF